MKKLLLFLLFPFSVQAADVYFIRDSQGNMVRLLDTPCEVSKGWLTLKKAEMKYNGKDYDACWIVVFQKNDKSNAQVFVFDSTGDVTKLPAADFRKELMI